MSRAGDPGEASPVASQRLDKWLWFARLVKTRTLAATLVAGGKVRVNRHRVDKPSHLLRPGDVLTATLNRKVRVLKVVAIGVRRGPAAEAQRLFEELTPGADTPKPLGRFGPPLGAAAGSEATARQRLGRMGRPTKRDRRQIDRLKSGLDES